MNFHGQMYAQERSAVRKILLWSFPSIGFGKNYSKCTLRDLCLKWLLSYIYINHILHRSALNITTIECPKIDRKSVLQACVVQIFNTFWDTQYVYVFILRGFEPRKKNDELYMGIFACSQAHKHILYFIAFSCTVEISKVFEPYTMHKDDWVISKLIVRLLASSWKIWRQSLQRSIWLRSSYGIVQLDLGMWSFCLSTLCFMRRLREVWIALGPNCLSF